MVGMFNPIQYLIGEYDAADALDRADDLSQASLDLIKQKKLGNHFWEASKMALKIKQDYLKNGYQLKEVRKVVDRFFKMTNEDDFKNIPDEFLALYSGYTPMVNKDEIAKFMELLGNMVDEACDELSETSTMTVIVAGGVADSGVCITIKSDLEGLEEIYSQMYDFQDDLMDSMAEVVKENLAYLSAGELITSFQESKVDMNDAIKLKVMSVKMLVVNQIYKTKVITYYCNYLEYINGGVQPDVCKKALLLLDDASIDELISFNGKHLSCSNPHPHPFRIPTSKSKDGDTAFIDLDRLYSGKPTLFKIPDANWLAENKWIYSRDRFNHAFYLHDFQIFLPDIVTAHSRYIRVEIVSSSDIVQLQPGKEATRYYLQDKDINKFNFDYKDALDSNGCDADHLKRNPSDLCRDQNKNNKKSTDACIREQTKAVRKIQPSVFSTWVIKAYENHGDTLVKPNFTTPAYVAANIKLCAKEIKGMNSCIEKIHGNCAKNAMRKKANKPVCCGNNKYWNREKKNGNGRLGGCDECPSGSKRSITGTYCYAG